MFLIIKYIAAHLTQNLFKNHPTLFFTPPPPTPQPSSKTIYQPQRTRCCATPTEGRFVKCQGSEMESLL